MQNDMGHSNIRIKVRRRKVAHLAARSKQFSVKNNTITTATEDAIKQQGPWKHEKYPQTKPLDKYPDPQDYQKKLWKNLGTAAKMEAYVQDKLKKWDMKHPKPCPEDDMFKDEFIPKWEKEREEALIRIRDFVVSIYDKLPLVGRFKMNTTSTAVYQEKKIADIKDIAGEGHKVNDLKPDSRLLKKAQHITNKIHAKHTNLVCTNLGDHKRKHGRIILPKAA